MPAFNIYKSHNLLWNNAQYYDAVTFKQSSYLRWCVSNFTVTCFMWNKVTYLSPYCRRSSKPVWIHPKQQHLPVIADQSQDGRSCRQAWGPTVHQWSGCEGQRRCAGLLPHLCLCPVRGHSWHPGADRTVRLHFLFPLCLSPLLVAHSQSWTAMEQIL